MSTTIAVLVPIAGLVPPIGKVQIRIFKVIFRLLKPFVKGKKVAVLSSPARTSISHAQCIAEHFNTSVSTNEGLLRIVEGDITNGFDYVVDFLVPQFGLVIVVVSDDVASELADALSLHVARPRRDATETGLYII